MINNDILHSWHKCKLNHYSSQQKSDEKGQNFDECRNYFGKLKIKSGKLKVIFVFTFNFPLSIFNYLWPERRLHHFRLNIFISDTNINRSIQFCEFGIHISEADRFFS